MYIIELENTKISTGNSYFRFKEELEMRNYYYDNIDRWNKAKIKVKVYKQIF